MKIRDELIRHVYRHKYLTFLITDIIFKLFEQWNEVQFSLLKTFPKLHLNIDN